MQQVFMRCGGTCVESDASMSFLCKVVSMHCPSEECAVKCGRKYPDFREHVLKGVPV